MKLIVSLTLVFSNDWVKVLVIAFNKKCPQLSLLSIKNEGDKMAKIVCFWQ